MSLFKLKSLWSRSYPQQEFDQRHLAVGKIDKKTAIALGSFKGKLRIFLVNRKQQLQFCNIYQNIFENGIIDIKFVTHPNQRIKSSTLAVLFFKSISFIHFTTQNGQNYQASTMNLQVQPSFAIGISPLSVMTLNSSIQYLNPKQILKIKVADPIYAFARQFSSIYFIDGQQLIQIEGSTQQWRIVVGRVKQIFIFQGLVIAIGERAIWQIKDAKIQKTKMIEDQVSCGTLSYPKTHAYNILLANYKKQLFVYNNDYVLLWAMKLDYVPICIIVNMNEQTKGMMIILSDQGNLQMVFSGVQMPEHIIQPISQQINYQKIQEETQIYLKRLRNKQQINDKKIQMKVEDKSLYKLYFNQVEKSFQNLENKNQLFVYDGKIIKTQLICQIISKQNLYNFKLQIDLPQNIISDYQNKHLNIAKNKQKIVFNLYSKNQMFPYQNQIICSIYYQTQKSNNKVIKQQSISIPLKLQCFLSGLDVDTKSRGDFTNNIIIKSSVQLPSFNQIFPQLIDKNQPLQNKSIKITLSNGVQCVIAYNKTCNKAKIESPFYLGLCYIILQFSSHVKKLSKQKKLNIELSVQIPLQQFFGIMKNHYQKRLQLKQMFKQVQKKSLQFRNCEKKFLVKIKQKMSNINSINKLLQYTYDRLINAANKYQEIVKQMDIINNQLSVAIKMIIQLLFIRSNPSQKAKKMAIGILGYEKQSLQRGWEDKIIANSSYFLNKKTNKSENVTFEQLQKVPLYVISKVNNGDWN